MARRNGSRSSFASRPTTRKSQPEPSSIIKTSTSSSSGLSGLFSQFATTAAGVAVGNAVGRAIVGAFSGSSAATSQQPQPQQMQESFSSLEGEKPSQQRQFKGCEADSKAFMECMRQNGDDISICQTYFDMLKQCQSASVY